MPLVMRLTVISWPGDQQQPTGGHNVLGGQPLLGGQPGQQSGARLGAEALHQLGHVLVHLRRGLGGGILLPGSWVESGDDRLGPGVEAGLVLARHPELPADHRDRQRAGELVHQVAALNPHDLGATLPDVLTITGDGSCDGVCGRR